VVDTLVHDPPVASVAASEPQVRRRRRSARPGGEPSALQLRVIGCASVGVALALWELAARRGWMNARFTSYPTAIAKALRREAASGALWEHSWASFQLFGWGLLLSVATAIPLGVVLGWYKRVNAAMDPFVSVVFAIPRLALIPLVLLWFGIGFQARLVVVLLSAFFPLLLNTTAGVRSVDRQLLRVARSFQGSDLQIFKTLALPSAVPYITTGLRQAIGQALIGVVAAEFFVGSQGLGAMITKASILFRTDVAMAGVTVVAIFALVVTALVRRLEQVVLKWYPKD